MGSDLVKYFLGSIVLVEWSHHVTRVNPKAAEVLGPDEGSRTAQSAMAADGLEVKTEDSRAMKDVTRIITLIYL